MNTYFWIGLLLISSRVGAISKPPDCSLFPELTLSQRDDDELRRYQNGILAEDVDLEVRVRDFLNVAPEELFHAIGAMFYMEVILPPSPAIRKELRSTLGESWPELIRRRIALEGSRILIGSGSWEQVWPAFDDEQVSSFLMRALMRLPSLEPRRPPPPKKSEHVLSRIATGLRNHVDETPSYEVLLAGSEVLQIAFRVTVHSYIKPLRLDYKSPVIQNQLLDKLRKKQFGDPINFLSLWLANSMKVLTTKVKENSSTSLEDQLAFFNDNLRIFMFKAIMWASDPKPAYSGSQIKEAFAAALLEHRKTLKELVASGIPPATLLEPDLDPELFLFKPHLKAPAAVPVASPDMNLAAFADRLRPLSELKPNQSYTVTFLRQVGHRSRTQLVQFTQRAIFELKQAHLRTGVSGADWLATIRLGPATFYGTDGIKLLQRGPLRRATEVELEAKRLHTPWRFHGWRDEQNRYIFDQFFQNK